MRDIMLDFCADLPNSAEWDIAAIQAKVLDVFGDLSSSEETQPGQRRALMPRKLPVS
jgi:hypothetical protein